MKIVFFVVAFQIMPVLMKNLMWNQRRAFLLNMLVVQMCQNQQVLYVIVCDLKYIYCILEVN